MRPRILLSSFLLVTACSGAVEPQSPGAAGVSPAAEAPPPPGEQAGRRTAPEEPAPVVAAPKEARLTLQSPTDGAVVKNPVALSFTVEGLTLAAAGPPTPGQGYAVLLPDGQPVAEGQPVPRGEQAIHLDDGAAAATLTFGPGPRTLTVQLVDGAGRSYGAALATTVSLTVNPELVDEQR
jgi:hypothetical protein